MIFGTNFLTVIIFTFRANSTVEVVSNVYLFFLRPQF